LINGLIGSATESIICQLPTPEKLAVNIAEITRYDSPNDSTGFPSAELMGKPGKTRIYAYPFTLNIAGGIWEWMEPRKAPYPPANFSGGTAYKPDLVHKRKEHPKRRGDPKNHAEDNLKLSYRVISVLRPSCNLLVIIAPLNRIWIRCFPDHLEIRINDESSRRIKGFHVNLGKVLEILIANLLLDLIRRAADGNLAAIFLLLILCIALIPIGTYIRRRFPVS